MQLIPAIDLLNGQCVRLFQGDFNDITYYDKDPVSLAKYYESLGLSRIHLVDLDGTRDGITMNENIVEQIINVTNLEVQMGGGLRSKSKIRKWLESSINYLVIGSYAIENIEDFNLFVDDQDKRKIIIALDVRTDISPPEVMIKGWKESSGMDLWSLIKEFINFGFNDFLITDIQKDGTLKGPNIQLYERCMKVSPGARFICSGGVSSIEDLIKLRDKSIHAAVAGKSLLENKISQREIKRFLLGE
tara:strand:+ start:856 stop:1593 length:738 start_codon:yes stop_codon:yes gene_type:complete